MNNTEINLTPTATLLEIDSSSLKEENDINSQMPCRSWGIASESNIGIVLVHGLGAHAGWFEALARRLKVKHIFVLSYDLVGFGKQKNKRYFSYHQWLDETARVFAYMQSVMDNKPIFLLGNSMGALIALASCQSIKPSGLALLSPAFAGHPNIFNLSYQLIELCKAIASPDSQLKLPYGTDLIAKQEQVRAWLDRDPERRQIVPRRMLLDLFVLTQSLRWQKIRLKCPLFMLTAGLDALVDNQVSELIFQQINSPNKKKTFLSGAWHDLALDPAVNQVADLLADWMNSAINQTQLAII
jgi:acylglycerol lipase